MALMVPRAHLDFVAQLEAITLATVFYSPAAEAATPGWGRQRLIRREEARGGAPFHFVQLVRVPAGFRRLGD